MAFGSEAARSSMTAHFQFVGIVGNVQKCRRQRETSGCHFEIAPEPSEAVPSPSAACWLVRRPGTASSRITSFSRSKCLSSVANFDRWSKWKRAALRPACSSVASSSRCNDAATSRSRRRSRSACAASSRSHSAISSSTLATMRCCSATGTRRAAAAVGVVVLQDEGLGLRRTIPSTRGSVSRGRQGAGNRRRGGRLLLDFAAGP